MAAIKKESDDNVLSYGICERVKMLSSSGGLFNQSITTIFRKRCAIMVRCLFHGKSSLSDYEGTKGSDQTVSM
jgi:hypothetical protein